jgi:hypothetical protein
MPLRLLLALADDASIGERTEYESVDVAAAVEARLYEP